MDMTLSPTVVVDYKSKTSQNGLKLLIALTPFWLVWAPGIVYWLTYVIFAYFSYVDLSLILLDFLFLGLICICAFTVFVCLQNKFLISAEGIKFPLRCLFELRWRLSRRWSEMERIDFSDSQKHSSAFVPNVNPDMLLVQFKDGGRLPLSLKSFKREDLQKFVLALQSYVPSLPMDPPLAKVNLGTAVDSTAQKAISFTQIWEDDMSSRFGSTVFVPLEPGNKLREGRLEILGQIAFGGLSAIYLAKNSSEKLCVVKEAVVPSSADGETKNKAMEMFQREAQILMSLNHARIAAVQDYFIECGRHYMLLEYIEGKDLRKFVKEKGSQHEKTVLRWAIEIAEVLEYLHGLNPPIVHRDLTPDNLVLEDDGSVTLIDFGAANQFLGAATGTLVGKQSYISPEQFRGKACPQSDLYALGATMHFLLTANDPEALSVSYPREADSVINEEVNKLVAALTALELSDRIQTAAQLKERCQAILTSIRLHSTAGV